MSVGVFDDSGVIAASPVALALLLTVVLGLRHLLQRPPPLRAVLAGAGLAVLALVVRLAAVPALSRHLYDGHEAVYYALFTHQRAPGAGDTTLYPALQWLWWSLGAVLPAQPWVPVVMSAMVGSCGVVLVAAATTRLAGEARVDGALPGLVAGLVVALHPGHAAWSSSAYNVVIPSTLLAVSLWAVAAWRTGHGGSRTEEAASPALVVLAAAAGVAAVGCRLEYGMMALPIGLLALLPAPGRELSAAGRMRAWLPGVAVVVLLTPLAMGAVTGDELPGAGERAVAWSANVGFLAPWRPLDGPLGVLLVLLACASAATRSLSVALGCGVGLTTVHLGMATFDDYAQRHTLPALPLVAVLVGVGLVGPAEAWWARARAAGRDRRSGRTAAWGSLGALGAAALLVVEVGGLADLRPRFYGSPEAFAEVLSVAPFGDLPRWWRAEGRAEPGQPDPVADLDCGWVAEDPAVARDPARSHFNLLDPGEARGLRGADGCLRFCLDLQDWAWTSRGVRDRAMRLSRLYTLQPRAVVVERDSGYQCLVLDVGPRRCCGDGSAAAGTGPARAQDASFTVP